AAGQRRVTHHQGPGGDVVQLGLGQIQGRTANQTDGGRGGVGPDGDGVGAAGNRAAQSNGVGDQGDRVVAGADGAGSGGGGDAARMGADQGETAGGAGGQAVLAVHGVDGQGGAVG